MEMRIAVLIKHTVDVRNVRINPETGEPSLEGKPGLDRADLHAISDAIDLRESGDGDVVVVGFGPAAMKDDLVTALATGVDEAIHVLYENQADTLSTSRGIADVLRDGGFDVILTGKLSDDYGAGQVGMQVAELLGIPHLSGVLGAAQEGDDLLINYELDGFPDEITVPTPILLVQTAREGEPKRHSSLRGMMTAKRKTVELVEPASDSKSPLQWTAPMAARRGGDRIVVKGEEPAEAAKKLADWLKEHRLVG